MIPPDESIRVLHVDDEPDLADMAATFLEREDDRFNVETATSASEGVDRLARGDFDCVVSDYNMPGKNGIEFLKDVREEHGDLPFILYTGRGSEEVASDAISAGVTDYLQKESGTGQYAVLANRIRNTVEKYRAQTQLADREQRLNLFFEESPLGVVEWNEDFEFVRLNDTAQNILGYEDTELKGESWEIIVPEFDRDPVGVVVSELLEAEGGHHSINENVRKDGQRIICEWHNRVVTDENNEVITIFSQFQDITDRRRQERRFEAIFNNTYTFAGLMEPDGTLIEANERALSFGGLDRDDVVGKHLWETEWVQSNDEARATVREAVEQARAGELFRDEIRIQGSEQEAIIDFSVRPITDEEGEVMLLIPEGRDITQRKNQERKRQQIINRVTDAIVEVDADWTFTLVNEQAEELYNMAEEDLLGQNFWEVFHEAQGTRFEEEYREVMETREPTSFVEYFSQLNGWFDIEAYPKEDGGIAFYFVEVTEQREHQHDLEQANILLSTLFETLPVGVLAEDADRDVLAVNDRMIDLFDLPSSPEEVQGADCEWMAEQVSEMFVDSNQFVDRIKDLVADREPMNNEELALHDGRTFERDYRPIELPDSRGHLWLYRDITENKTREERLQETTARLEALFDNSPDLIDVLDPEGTILDVNHRFCEELGYEEDEVLGRPIWEIDQLVDEDDVRGLLGDFVHGERRKFDGVYRRRDGSTFPVEVHLLRLDIEGQDRFLAISRDISERKQHELGLEQRNQQLEEFASVVSHDLRNPLNVAQGRLKFAQEECDSEHLEDVANALARSQNLIDDLLTLAKEGNRVSDIESVDFGMLAENCWRNVETGKSTITVETDSTIRADRSRLTQLLENLYRNAIEHGGDDVIVTVGDLSGGFYVEDDGPGISPDKRKEVFDVGFSTTESGTGFGLSIIKQIANAHSWEVGIAESDTGGARIEFTGVVSLSADE